MKWKFWAVVLVLLLIGIVIIISANQSELKKFQKLCESTDGTFYDKCAISLAEFCLGSIRIGGKDVACICDGGKYWDSGLGCIDKTIVKKQCNVNSDCRFSENTLDYGGECKRDCFNTNVNLPKCLPSEPILLDDNICLCKENICEIYEKTDNYMTEEEVIEIAKSASGMEIPDNIEAEVEYSDNEIVVTFPFDLPPDTLGPDYYAKVTIDKFSGEVIKVLVAS